MKIENVELKHILKGYKKPINIYSNKKIKKNIKVIKKFGKICYYYAVKANNNKKILNIINMNDIGFETVSIGEIKILLSIGVRVKKIIFSGIGKSYYEIKKSILLGINKINIESIQETYRVIKICNKLKRKVKIFLRLNLKIDCKSHPNISTGRKDSKFGLTFKEALKIKKIMRNSNFIKISGIGFHLGSQIKEKAFFLSAIKKILNLKDKYFKSVKKINLGGGIGINYNKSNFIKNTKIKKDILCHISKIINNRKEKFIMELGRSIIADTCITIFRVEYIKRNFVITDLGMNNIIRPALYNSFHKILNIKKRNKKKYNIVGPICECSDFLANNIKLGVKQNDYLIIKDTGAYCYSMSSNYNSRPKCRQILIKNKKIILLDK
ncbi:diaminopimelate decarboxylase [Candidatus Vidania fulgoroideorum]